MAARMDGAAESAGSTRSELLTESFERVLAYSLRSPDSVTFRAYFPTLPEPVVEALLDLYRQVLLHVEANSKAEFADICKEHSVQKYLAEIEHAVVPGAAGNNISGGLAPNAVAIAVAQQLRNAAKQSEVAQLQLQLSKVKNERDGLAASRLQQQAHIEQVAAGYKAIPISMTRVLDASKGAVDQS